LKKLGTVPDDELAMKLGVSFQFIREKRAELGIAVCRRSSLKWTDKIIKMMGVISDSEIAKKLGCTTGLVQLKRVELEIAPYNATSAD
jgi:hypothetical protein